MIVDLSHGGWKTAADAAETSIDPVILSHSNPYALCPNRRNVPDELPKLVASTGGCVGVNAHPALCQTVSGVRPTLGSYLDIIDYLVELIGPEHVSLGIDLFVGFQPWQHACWNFRYDELRNPWGTTDGLGEALDIPNITNGLVEHGYPENQILDILGGQSSASHAASVALRQVKIRRDMTPRLRKRGFDDSVKP